MVTTTIASLDACSSLAQGLRPPVMTTRPTSPLNDLALQLARLSLFCAASLFALVTLSLTFASVGEWMPASLLITTPASALGLLLGSGAVAAVFSPGRVGLQRWQMTALLVLLLVQSGIHLAAALDSSVSLAPAQWETPMSMSTLAALALVLLCVACERWMRGRLEHEFSVVLLLSLCVFLTVGYLSEDSAIVDESQWLRTGEWTLASLWLIALAIFARMGASLSRGEGEWHRVKQRWQSLRRAIAGD